MESLNRSELLCTLLMGMSEVAGYYMLATKKRCFGVEKVHAYSTGMCIAKLVTIGQSREGEPTLLDKGYVLHTLTWVIYSCAHGFKKIDNYTLCKVNQLLKGGITLMGGITTFNYFTKNPTDKNIEKGVLVGSVVLAVLEAFFENAPHYVPLRAALGIATGGSMIYFSIATGGSMIYFSIKNLFKPSQEVKPSQEGEKNKKRAEDLEGDRK